MEYHKHFTVKITLPDTDEEVEATAWFAFYPGYKGTYNTPPEPPEVVIDALFVEGRDVLGLLSTEALRHVYGEIMTIMLESNYGV